jgi:hypothetical protein
MICPVSVEGGDFNDPANPKPAIQTSDTADAEMQLAFFSVFMTGIEGKAASMLDWRCGGNSFIRNVTPMTGYVTLEKYPLMADVRPWNNWNWSCVEVPNKVIGHVNHSEYAVYTRGLNIRPDWPHVKIHGNGAGGIYLFQSLDGRPHGENHRKILVENTAGPVAMYHVQSQYSRGLSELEISHAANVAIYGMKMEGGALLVRVLDSEDVLIAGTSYHGTSPNGKVLIRSGHRVRVTNSITDWSRKPEQRSVPAIKVERENEPDFTVEVNDRPILFQID